MSLYLLEWNVQACTVYSVNADLICWYICTLVTSDPMRALPCLALIAALTCWSVPAMSTPPSTQVHSFRLDAPLQKVFPLFTAEGERSWAPGWDPIILSGARERGSAFATRADSGMETTWIVADYRPAEGRVSYARLAHGSNIGLVDVTCVESGGATEVTVRYTLTGLNDEGRAFVREFLEPERYARMIEHWRAATSAALAAEASSPGRHAAH